MCEECKTKKNSYKATIIIIIMIVAALCTGLIVNAVKHPAKQIAYNGSVYMQYDSCIMLDVKGKTPKQVRTDLDSLLSKAQIDTN